MVGKVLGNRYRVLREIGSGGMAWVYLAEDTKENTLVATKVLYPQFGEDLSYIHRFNREAKLASAMTDPHIVRVLDYGADRDVYYLVMEYIEGKELRKVLEERGPFPWKYALDILDQLATGLEHAHMHGVVHRDIKPQNMMLDDTGLLKVLDFGIARVSTLPSLTQSGFIGSPYYVSPEQAMSEDVDIRSDIYSAGIVLYELLSGRIPFDAKSPWSIISQHIANEPPRIELPDAEETESLHALLNRMVAKDRADRFQTPTALRRAIAATLAGRPIIDIGLDTRPINGNDKIDMAASLYHRAVEAVEAEEWARAVDLLTQVLTLDPNHQEAAEKLPQAENQASVVSNYNAAGRALERRAWAEAVEYLKTVVEVMPTFKDAQEKLAQAKVTLEKEDAQKTVATRYAEGVSYVEAERWPEAIAALKEVQRLSPGYKRTMQLLAEATRAAPSTSSTEASRPMEQSLSTIFSRQPWSIAAVLVIVLLAFFLILGLGNSATGDDSLREGLKVTYEAALAAIEEDDPQTAIKMFDEILAQDPDYADAADRRRELVTALTPTPETPIPDENPLAADLNRVEDAINLQEWSEALNILQQVQDSDPDFDQARVSSLLCDAYMGRGLETLETLDQQPVSSEANLVGTALADFEAGAAECPRRRDLQDQAERAAIYLEALDTSENNGDRLIQTLTPIVAAEPNYADGNAKRLLYQAYVERGRDRRELGEIVGALSDYEAALALSVDDPSKAQTDRAELLLSLQSPEQSTALTAEAPQQPAAETPAPESEATRPANNPPPPPNQAYPAPTLMTPANDELFAGRFSEVIIEWQPVGELAADEYYDLTIMHIFAEEPQYTGFATQETRLQLKPEDVGVGQAGGDRFYWWVTVRKANSAPSPEALDRPLSPQSEAGTFIWTP